MHLLSLTHTNMYTHSLTHTISLVHSKWILTFHSLNNRKEQLLNQSSSGSAPSNDPHTLGTLRSPIILSCVCSRTQNTHTTTSNFRFASTSVAIMLGAHMSSHFPSSVSSRFELNSVLRINAQFDLNHSKKTKNCVNFVTLG